MKNRLLLTFYAMLCLTGSGVAFANADNKANLNASNTSTTPGDVDITNRIRSQITSTSMSVPAQNIQVLTVNGQVTLKGTVPTAAEKTALERIAAGVVGTSKVVNQITVTQ